MLKSRLHKAEKECKQAKQEAEDAVQAAEADRQELFELRELIYKLQNSEENEENLPDDLNISFPYSSGKRLVIYGGHETWLKIIKPMLPNARFIEPDKNPDAGIIRNADVIWMQSNAMPHCIFNKIMEIARTHRIPVKYFAYASAEKCALQLAEDDMLNP